MSRPHDNVVEAQFGSKAAAYVASPVHASGEDLDALEAVAERERPERALDLGSGGGHVAYRLAHHAGSVVAVDLSAAMLDAVRETAGSARSQISKPPSHRPKICRSTMPRSISSPAAFPPTTGMTGRRASVKRVAC